MEEFILQSNNVVTADGLQKAAIWVRNGTIQEISSEIPETGIKRMDAGMNVIMPGVIDPHVHINEPGRTDWEGFDTITRSALAGGVTTLVDMPLNSSPVTTSVAAFEEKIAATKDQLHTHCGFWGGLVPGNENEIEPLIEKGVLGFKAFLTHSGIDEFPNVTEADLRKAMPLLAKYNLPLLVHCELTDDTTGMGTDKRSYKAYVASRPKKWEDNAIALMIRLCEEFYCPVHIVHLSSANSIHPIQRAKEQGLPLTVETAQHYLFFSAEEINDGETAFKCAPPIREKENNEQLWQALKEGIIDFVATDHSPATPKLKELQSGDFTKAWGGIASIQLALPALWTVAKKKGCSLTDISRWLSANPARLIGQQEKKGCLVKGMDADLLVFNPSESFLVSPSIIYHKHKVTPYAGRELTGTIEQTYLNGRKVFDKGWMELNCGEIIRRK